MQNDELFNEILKKYEDFSAQQFIKDYYAIKIGYLLAKLDKEMEEK